MAANQMSVQVLLSPAQEAVVNHRGGDLQVIACAGSGKTESISRRVAGLIAEGAEPASIVAFTFTERAATELKDRITRRVAERQGGGVSRPPRSHVRRHHPRVLLSPPPGLRPADSATLTCSTKTGTPGSFRASFAASALKSWPRATGRRSATLREPSTSSATSLIPPNALAGTTARRVLRGIPPVAESTPLSDVQPDHHAGSGGA